MVTNIGQIRGLNSCENIYFSEMHEKYALYIFKKFNRWNRVI